MPKNNSVASITTLWENNPDTPITSANLSRLQDLTTSYLNTDDESFGIHVEGSILYPHPIDVKQILIKRGTIIQIINESVDMVGNPIISKNSMYRVFDIGLEDIILTYADTDDTQLNKTTWGAGNNEWFVFICDKDDSTIYNKNSSDAYGGGAQILISKNSDYPRGQIPGRPSYNYSSKDTRLIGGFKTNGNNIVSSSVWDIAGKYDKVKAKAYYILDEYKAGGAEYRQIQLSDLNTSSPSQFNSGVTVVGDLSVAQNLSVGNVNAANTTLVGTMSQTGNVDITGNIVISGTSNLTGKLTAGDIAADDITINFLIIGDVAEFNDDIIFDAPVIHTGNYSLTGNMTHIGVLSQNGSVALGGFGKSITATGDIVINGPTMINGDITIPSINGLSTIFSIDRDLQQIGIDANGFVISSEVQINDKFGVNAGGQDITLYTTRGILSSVGPTYEWRNSGSFKVDNGVFTVQQNSSNKTLEVLTNQININAAVDAIIPAGETFAVKNNTGSTIFGIEDDISLPSEKRVAINTVLDLSASSADNALNVTGNGHLTGDLTVDGLLYANIQGTVVGGASSWTNNLTINLIGDVGGSVTFNGDEGVLNVTTQVYNDSHTHNTIYYTKNELQTSGSALVNWGNISGAPTTYTPTAHTHNIYLEESEINWSLLQSRGLVGSTGGDLGVENVLARIDHRHDTRYSLLGHSHTEYAPIADYVIAGGDVDFNVITVSSLYGGNITSDNGMNVLSTSGITFRQNQYEPIGNTYKLWSSTMGDKLVFNGSRVVTAVGENSNIAPAATQLATPQTLAFTASNGISSSTVTGQIGGGVATVQVGLTLDAAWIATQLDGTGLVRAGNVLNVDFGTSATQVAVGNHNHDARYYTESEMASLTDQLIQNILTTFKNGGWGSVPAVINPISGNQIIP